MRLDSPAARAVEEGDDKGKLWRIEGGSELLQLLISADERRRRVSRQPIADRSSSRAHLMTLYCTAAPRQPVRAERWSRPITL